ncbi:MAG: hypothetical protein IT565_13525 [Rhodospirillales bacterium]|nr:hypothetical protein [Rhodospirillales bacterium]
MGWMKGIAGAVALTLVWAPNAMAADPDVPRRDPKGFYRYLTQEADSTTSTCIGNPITPLCAVETVLACFVRKNDDFCRRATWPGFPDLEFSKSAKSPFDDMRYYVQFAKKLDATNAGKYRVGDVVPEPRDVVIGIKKAFMAPGGWGNIYPQPNVYLLRRYKMEWRVVTWHTASTDP